MKQTCITCGEEKEISQFEKQKARPNHRKICKVCRYKARDREKEKERHRQYMKARRETEPEVLRQNWERATYGICKEDIPYTECWICGSKRRLCIDHCHNSNQVRGLLCTKCNSALGMFEDNISSLEKAIEYLKDGPHFQLPRSYK